jgi:hypothetical protein
MEQSIWFFSSGGLERGAYRLVSIVMQRQSHEFDPRKDHFFKLSYNLKKCAIRF